MGPWIKIQKSDVVFEIKKLERGKGFRVCW